MGINLGKMQDEFKRRSQKGSRPGFLQLADGDNAIRVLPPSTKALAETIDFIGYDRLVHYGVGPAGADRPMVCPKSTVQEARCPVCEFVRRAYDKEKAEGDASDIKAAKRINKKPRFYLNVINLKDVAKGVQILDCCKSIYVDIIKYCTPDAGDPTSIAEGRNFTITKTVSGDNRVQTKYSVTPELNKSNITDKLPSNWKEAIDKLEASVPKVNTFEEMQDQMEGKLAGGDEDHGHDDEDDAEHVAAAAAATAAAAAATAGATPAPTAPAAEKKEEKKEEVAKPACFGEKYSNRKDECQKCAHREPCKDTFLNK